MEEILYDVNARVANVTGETHEYIRVVFNTLKAKQDELNKVMTGNPDYATTFTTKDGKHINYGECLMSELVELLDSRDWKHWKAGKLDKDNINVEIVDILHFVLSASIVFNVDSSANRRVAVLDKRPFDKSYDFNTIASILTAHMMQASATISSATLEFRMTDGRSYDEYVTAACLDIMDGIIMLYMVNNDIETAEEVMDSLAKEYFVKNVLNGFRMANGYKEGTYRKLWLGVEDNVVAYEIANSYVGELEGLEDYLQTNLELRYKSDVPRTNY